MVCKPFVWEEVKFIYIIAAIGVKVEFSQMSQWSIKGEVHFITLAEVSQISEFKLIFLGNIRLLITKCFVKAYKRMGKKIYINELRHITKLVACEYSVNT